MKSVSSRFLAALRGSHTSRYRVRVLTTFQTGVDPEGTEVDIVTGSVTLDGTANERASLDLTLDSQAGQQWPANQFGVLAPFGNELFVERGIAGLGVPENVPVQVTIRAWGAQGGGASGGLGGYSEGTFIVLSGTVLNIRVGGQGQAPVSQTGQVDPGQGLPGGFNGGGDGGYYFDDFNSDGILRKGGSGGGASDVRWNGDTLADRMIVAGGGGGASTHATGTGGNGGGLSGAAGGSGPNTGAEGGGGGTDSAGGAGGTTGAGSNGGNGASGVGGNGGVWVTLGNNGGGPGGGGGGLFGGGGGKSGAGFGEAGGGGGGSGFVDSSAVNAVTNAGVRSGDGRVEIEVNGQTTVFTFTGSSEQFTVPGFVIGPEYVPLGYFRVETIEQEDAPRSPIRITARDRMAAIIEARMLEPRTFAAGTTFLEVFENLVLEVYPSAVLDIDDEVASSTLREPATVEEDRYAFLQDMATSRGRVMFFDHRGVFVVAPEPASDTPVFTVDEGADGVLVNLRRQLSRAGVYNAVVAEGTEADYGNEEPPARAVVFDDNPNSATYFFGPFGQVPRFYSSPFIFTDAQAQSAAASILSRTTGIPYTLDITAIPNPALEPLDPITVIFEAGREEIHIIDVVTIPLTSDQPMTVNTRSLVQFIAGQEGS